ncbi:MAG: tRNA (N(6)-L-threonylcarbamoyladenosine(37)-C(2))-methylthiotransferase MtaB [Lachnospiraceae bacterium]|nr:tRNA (N(6)-L-threonylcarbamoyladenosine(37)-C(2))-methylthiotransferase MtaB [Lachnospiraceae bacterium]MBR5766735.1 tRNA (N(6)-L-threonylcarbamoyladenosine(37)-C(2))-methylthiotransferase MtaB [Lachnospiraceae bacterium]
MKKVAFHNLGCKVNAYEMELMQQNFIKNGFEIVPFTEKADIYIINTCTVTNIADRKSRQMLHRAKALNPDAIIVAAGCYVETDREGAAADDAVDIVVGNKDKADIVDIVERALSDTGTVLPSGFCEDQTEEPSPCPGFLTTLTEHTRANIKIQDGCDQYCSYCIIPFARGHVTSRDEEETVREVTALAKKGCREFVLNGIHLSSYGLDKAYNLSAKDGSFTNRPLIDIIKRISQIEGVERIRLSSLEPRIITEEFLDEVSRIKSFCPHFHLSLQSGSDTVLKRMNRRYDTEEYLEKVKLIRQHFEHPAITTDVITGFPGETEEEFKETREFLDKVDFYRVHVFAYSRRRGTVADKLPGQITQKVKAERSKVLIADSDKRAERFREYYLNKETDVLIEESEIIDRKKYQVGYNREYVRFAIDSDDDLTGSIVSVTATEKEDEHEILCGLQCEKLG